MGDQEEYAENFARYDAGEKGYLDERDVAELLNDLGLGDEDDYQQELLDSFAKYDADGNQTIELEEFPDLWDHLIEDEGGAYGLEGSAPEGTDAWADEGLDGYALYTCPDNMVGGDFMLVAAPDGSEVEIQIPGGVQPGEEFEALVGAGDGVALEDAGESVAAAAAAAAAVAAAAAPQAQEKARAKKKGRKAGGGFLACCAGKPMADDGPADMSSNEAAPADIDLDLDEPEQYPEDEDYLLVVCPDGMLPGEVTEVTLADGSLFTVEIPAGIEPGDEFEVYIGPADEDHEAATRIQATVRGRQTRKLAATLAASAASDRSLSPLTDDNGVRGGEQEAKEEAEDEQAEDERQADDLGFDQPEGSDYAMIQVPVDGIGGQTLTLGLSDGRKVKAEIPAGLRPGDQFEVFVGEEEELAPPAAPFDAYSPRATSPPPSRAASPPRRTQSYAVKLYTAEWYAQRATRKAAAKAAKEQEKAAATLATTLTAAPKPTVENLQQQQQQQQHYAGEEGQHANAFDSVAFTGNRSAGTHAPVVNLVMPSHAERTALFRRIDYNGNGLLSLAEIDKAVVELWPHFDHKPALMRAYKAADRNGDGFIKKREFRLLLKYVIYFSKLWHKFEEIDDDGDRRITLDEFMQHTTVLGHRLSREEATAEFQEMDDNAGGVILFDEFCTWCAERHIEEDEGEGGGSETPSAARASEPARSMSDEHEHARQIAEAKEEVARFREEAEAQKRAMALQQEELKAQKRAMAEESKEVARRTAEAVARAKEQALAAAAASSASSSPVAVDGLRLPPTMPSSQPAPASATFTTGDDDGHGPASAVRDDHLRTNLDDSNLPPALPTDLQALLRSTATGVATVNGGETEEEGEESDEGEADYEDEDWSQQQSMAMSALASISASFTPVGRSTSDEGRLAPSVTNSRSTAVTGDPHELHAAAKNGDVNAALAEINEGGVDVNSPDAVTGNTALHWAAVRNHPLLVLALLEADADPSVQNRAGFTAVEMVVNKDGINGDGTNSMVLKLLRHNTVEPDQSPLVLQAASDQEDSDGKYSQPVVASSPDKKSKKRKGDSPKSKSSASRASGGGMQPSASLIKSSVSSSTSSRRRAAASPGKRRGAGNSSNGAAPRTPSKSSSSTSSASRVSDRVSPTRGVGNFTQKRVDSAPPVSLRNSSPLRQSSCAPLTPQPLDSTFHPSFLFVLLSSRAAIDLISMRAWMLSGSLEVTTRVSARSCTNSGRSWRSTAVQAWRLGNDGFQPWPDPCEGVIA